MKRNIKSKKGFTLIELLVVIGILAVLAAIAIPSVAGLIDRANVSADKTNSNEMTNAMERFASEYELFCQDIASGTFDKTDMDSAQSRVYNVLGIENRAGIELVEIDTDETVNADTIAIYRDTKYPANAYTAQLIVQNYTKTSSSTFEPKQSDMHYWYSPDCGVVVFAEPNADQDKENKLNNQIISGMDAKGNTLGSNTKWIDLTLGVGVGEIDSFDWTGINKTTLSSNTWENVQKVISNGKIGETQWKVGDTAPSFTHNGQVCSARMIGIGQDGSNTATFMITSGLGKRSMGSGNSGGYNSSSMSFWLNSTVYNNLSDDVKTVILPVNKTNNYGQQNPTGNDTASHKLFLLSAKEVGLIDEVKVYNWYPIDSMEAESSFVYDYFQVDGQQKRSSIATNFGGFFWLRTAYCSTTDYYIVSTDGKIAYAYASGTGGFPLPAFVVG